MNCIAHHEIVRAYIYFVHLLMLALAHRTSSKGIVDFLKLLNALFTVVQVKLVCINTLNFPTYIFRFLDLSKLNFDG